MADAPAETTLTSEQGTFELQRWPARPKDTLRAWDAADEMLLAHIAGVADPGENLGQAVALDGSIAVVNDSTGALCTALAAHRPTLWTDSYVARRATEENLRRNGVDPGEITILDSTSTPTDSIDVLLVKIPKTAALLEYQLRAVAPLLAPDAVVIGAAMTKHIHNSTIESFERLIGPTRTSRARRKARLVHARRDTSIEPGEQSWPRTFVVDPGHHVVTNHANVFSSSRLDAGTAFFLQHLPEQSGAEQIVDLGCGNGIVGTIAASDNPDAEVTFVDESYMAVESARSTFRASFGSQRPARFVAGNGLSELSEEPQIADQSVDVVLINPPFHDNHALGDQVAWQLFSDARRTLRPGGEVWVVGNRHLAYHAKLKRLFGNCDIVASNSKFVVFRATKVTAPR